MNPLQKPIAPDVVMAILNDVKSGRKFKHGGEERVVDRYWPGRTTGEEFVEMVERELEPMPVNGFRADLAPWGHVNGL